MKVSETCGKRETKYATLTGPTLWPFADGPHGFEPDHTARQTVCVESKDPGVGTRTLRGMFWAYGSYVGGRLLVLVSIAILARLLTPSEFGLVAIALLVTTILDTVSDLGVSQALIVVKDDEVHAKADTAWTFGVILGASLTILTAAMGPIAAAFFDEPALTVMLPVLGLNFLLRALGVTHFALAQKQLDFRTRTLAEAADVLVRGAVGIGLALGGAGAYSLVGGYLAGSAALTISLWALIPWRPSRKLRREHLGGLLRFGGALTALDILSAIVTNVDYLIIGRVLGKAELGLYTLGWRLPELIIINLSVVAGLVLFPAFAGIERRVLADAYLTSLRYMVMLSLPVAIGLCILAEPLVLIAFGGQWVDSIAVMQVLTVSAFFVTVAIPGGIAYKAVARADVLVKLAIPHAVLAIVSITLFADQGIVAVAGCQAVLSTVFCIIQLGLAARLLETGWRPIWGAIRYSLLAGTIMAALVALLSAALEDPYVTLALAVPVAALSYLGTLWLLVPDQLVSLWERAVQSRSRSDRPEEPPLDIATDARTIDLAAGHSRRDA